MNGLHDHASRFYHHQRGTLCGRRCTVCLWPWHGKQSGAEKDESCIKIVAGGLIPVSRFVYERLKNSQKNGIMTSLTNKNV